MKDYKILLAGLVLLLLILLIGVFTWLWNNNRKNIDPLPIVADQTEISNADSAEQEITKSTSSDNTLYIQADSQLQVALDDLIVIFESRYPNIQVLTSYVPAAALLILPDNNLTSDHPTPLIVNTDLIISSESLNEARLSSLQSQIGAAKTKVVDRDSVDITDKSDVTNANEIIDNAINNDIDGKNPENANIGNEKNKQAHPSKQTDSADDRNLVSFVYALKGNKAADGVILTENPVAISFRNFMLSSVGQDILRKYDFDNIDGYRNSMDDLFNPSSSAQSDKSEGSVEVADALSNGK